MRILCFLGFCSVMAPELLGQRRGLSLVNQWGQLEWAYRTPDERQHAIDTGEFVPGNGVPIDVDVQYGTGRTRVFVTVPRFTDGVPGTLNVVSRNQYQGNPTLMPYPSWDWHRNPELCKTNRLISVFRTQMDECGRFWVLDAGRIGDRLLCRPQIIAFDPITDRVVHRYEIPEDQIDSPSILVTPVIDVRDAHSGCRDTFVYMADVIRASLIVYDMRRQRSWRITNKLMYPNPEWGTFDINGDQFDLMDGIIGMALSPYRPGYDRNLYFHAMASNTENYVSTEVIRNRTLFENDREAVPRQFKVFNSRRPSQSAAEAMDKNGVLFFGLMSETAIACWNSETYYDQRNFDIVERNPQTLQFPSGVKIVHNLKGEEELWVMTCAFQKVANGKINPNEPNFRIQAAKISDLIAGSKCQTSNFVTPSNTQSLGPSRTPGLGSYGKLSTISFP